MFDLYQLFAISVRLCCEEIISSQVFNSLTALTLTSTITALTRVL